MLSKTRRHEDVWGAEV